MSMLRDADLSLANWLKSILPPGTGVRFDAPRVDWEKQRGSGSGSSPGTAFVSAFLCEVHRDSQDLPRAGWSEARDRDGRLLGRQPAPRYYRLTYLITAWAGAAGAVSGDEASRRTLEEHELLGLLIEACTDTETIAQDHLAGTLAEAELPSFVRCASDEAGLSMQGLWDGFGVAPHAHLELEMVAPVVPQLITELGPPAREIVVGARQTQVPGPSGVPAGLGVVARRWERGTIAERPAESPGQVPQS